MKGASWAFRLVVSAVVLALLVALVPMRQLVDAMRQLPLRVWVATLLLFLAGHALSAFKWRLLIGPQPDLFPRLWLRAHFAGLAANLCLPGVAGGDVVRAAYVVRKTGGVEKVALASVVDRAIDMFALLLLAVAGAATAGQLRGVVGWMLAVASAFALAGIVLVLTGRRFLVDCLPSGLRGRLRDAALTIRRRPFAPAVAFVLSLGVQSLFICLTAWMGASVGLTPGLSAWFTAWPLAKLAALVPVSLAGLGVREAALAAFMRPFGVPSGAVVAVGLLWESVLVAGGLIGWLAMMGMRDIRVEPERDPVTL